MKKIAGIITAILLCALAAMPVMAAAKPAGFLTGKTRIRLLPRLKSPDQR